MTTSFARAEAAYDAQLPPDPYDNEPVTVEVQATTDWPLETLDELRHLITAALTAEGIDTDQITITRRSTP